MQFQQPSPYQQKLMPKSQEQHRSQERSSGENQRNAATTTNDNALNPQRNAPKRMASQGTALPIFPRHVTQKEMLQSQVTNLTQILAQIVGCTLNPRDLTMIVVQLTTLPQPLVQKDETPANGCGDVAALVEGVEVHTSGTKSHLEQSGQTRCRHQPT